MHYLIGLGKSVFKGEYGMAIILRRISAASSPHMAAAVLGNLTGLVFEKNRWKILQNVTWLKELNQVNFWRRQDSI